LLFIVIYYSIIKAMISSSISNENLSVLIWQVVIIIDIFIIITFIIDIDIDLLIYLFH